MPQHPESNKVGVERCHGAHRKAVQHGRHSPSYEKLVGFRRSQKYPNCLLAGECHMNAKELISTKGFITGVEEMQPELQRKHKHT